MKTVELEHAWIWKCTQCDMQNIAEDVVVEFSREEAEELNVLHPGETFRTGEWFCLPDEVKCRKCGAEFQSDPPMPEEG